MGLIAADGDLRIREMRDEPAEYGLISKWRSQPHVHEWWDPDDPPPTPDVAAEQYGARVRGEEPTTACIVELDGRPIGYLQFYRWRSWPDDEAEIDLQADPNTFGIDLFIGEPDLIGRGIGTRIVDLICDHLETSLGASSVALTTEITNERAQRAYEKAGFRRIRCVLDTDTRNGQRVVCWLMERRRAAPSQLDDRPTSP
jgi:aminoglycoside 6'-N-acetyltransferase